MTEGKASGTPQRYCTNCGAQIGPGDAFCGSCGARLSSHGTNDVGPTREIPRPVREWAGGFALPRLQFASPGRDALLGAGLALGCALLLVAAIYAVLAVRWAFFGSSIPGTFGLALFALIHGGAASAEVPPNPALFGIGGSLRLGLPVTTFALLPFLASLLAARFVAPRMRTPALFVLMAAAAYALVVAALAALGAASSASGEMTVRLEPDPLSNALRAFLWVGLGAMLGTAASRGPLLPARARQVLRGALWAVGVSLALALMLAVMIGLAQQALGEPDPEPEQAPGQEAPLTPEVLTPAAPSISDVGGVLEAIGVLVALVPVALGNLWLLAHGVPVGFQRAPDLSGIPLMGEALADVPLKVALLGSWPWGWSWRLLILAPVVGLLVGGMVAARGAPAGGRWRQGALVALPYAAMALLTAVLVGMTADVILAEAASLELAFRASLAWLLLLLPVGAVLGAAGGLLARADAFPAPRPNRAFLVTSAIGGLVLLASLPALGALSTGGTEPTASLASEDEAFSAPSFSAPPEPASTPPSDVDDSPPPEQAGVESPAHPAFDPLLPTLREKTSVPLMFPSELPEELRNVAVDADREGEEYGVLFLGNPPEGVEQSYVHANDVGTIVAAPEPQYGAADVFEATKEETVALPDGTEATLRHMEPKEGELVNQGPYWVGSFKREGQEYFLTLPLADPSGDIARQVLSSMVEVPGEGTSGGETAKDEAGQDGPAPGYNLVETPNGSLSVEVPQSWGVETGEDSEKDGAGPGTWSYHAGEYLASSITTAPNLDAWYSTGSSGAYLVASRSLAQEHTDQELTRSLYFANKSENCTMGPSQDYDRPPYSGTLQAWFDCGIDGADTYSVAAAPEGRGCVVIIDARVSEEDDREAIEHLIDTFEVDCGRVSSEPLVTSASTAPASASPAASAEPSSASATASAPGRPAGPAYDFIVVPSDTPPCPLGLDQVRAIYGPNVTCGEGGGYVPATSEE